MEQTKKIVWIVSFYTTPPEYDTHLRHRKFAEYLRKNGYRVIIISSSFIHGKNINLIGKGKKYEKRCYNGEEFIHIQTCSYVGNGLKRMFSIFQFAFRVCRLRKNFEHPNIIIHNAHVPFDSQIRYCARKLKAQYIVEIWDLWPESFVAYGMVSRKNPLLKIAYHLEKRLYACADRIIFTMEGGRDYIIEKKWSREQGGLIDLKKVIYINNGIDLKDFEQNKQTYRIEDEDLNNEKYFKVIYLGSIRLANDLERLVRAAGLLKDYQNIKFLIYGDGTEREKWEKYCRDHYLDNVIFKQKWVPLKYVPYILSCSSLNIMNYKLTPIGRFGGSQGKMFQYMASGKPICSNQRMGYDPIYWYGLGTAQKFTTDQEYAQTILSFYQMKPQEYEEICNKSKEAARKFDFEVLSVKLLKVLEELQSSF